MSGASMGSPKNQQQPHDIVWTAKAIAAVINRSERETYFLLENNLLPAVRVGRKWSASRARLIAHCSGDDVERRVS
jgi:hypothetical protein